jgi:rSAM/selenodomain-associated transferase 1
LSIPVVVFAKAPEPGRTKTRLAPALGEEGAARLHRTLARRAIATAFAANIGPVVLACAPDVAHPFFEACAREFDVALEAQGEGDLGERMSRAFERHAPAVLIGTDCPALTATHLREAGRALALGLDAVLAPAEDGGYVLIALARPAPEVFAGIAWGGPDVLAATRTRMGQAELVCTELPLLWDVDRPEDLARLRERFPRLSEEAGLA